MKELHVLVDFENVQPTLQALAKLAPGFTDVWLFHGPHQVKHAQAFAASHARVVLVPRSGQGPNALDFHVAFYLGYVAAKHPDAELVVVANDRGYDPMLAHARMLKFRARRVGYKAPAAKPVAAKKAVVKKPVAKKVVVKPATPKPLVPAKVVAAKQAPAAKNAPAAKKAVKKAVAKKAALSQPAKTVKPAKAAPSPKAPRLVPTPAALPTSTPASKLLARITKGLARMGDKAPTKLKSFLSTLKSMQGKDSTAADVEAMAQTLQSKGVVLVQDGVVTYPK